MPKMKKKNLSLLFGIKLGAIILVLVSVLEILSIRIVRKSFENNFKTTTQELVSAHVQGLAYRNSKFSQQLRLYTTSDPVAANAPVEEIISWLTAHRKARSSDFKCMYFVDYETGMAYSDDGDVIDVTGEEYYQKMKYEGLSQYISNPKGTSVEDAVFYVCKSVSVQKKTIGCFVGSVSHKTLAKAINLITCGESGFAMLIGGDGIVMAGPDDSAVMKVNFRSSNEKGYEGIGSLGNKMVAGESGAEWVNVQGRNELIVFSPIEKTPWSLAIIVPETQVYAASVKLAKIMLIVSIIITVILVITASVSIFRTLKPLRLLDRNLNQIASGNADLTHRIKVTSNNEIGSVSMGFNTFIEKLQYIMKDIKGSKENLSNAGTKLHDGIGENSRSIHDILSNIDSVKTQITNQSSCVEETAGAVNEIASNISSLERMIETQSEGVSQASSAVEEMIGNISSVNLSVAKMAESFEQLENKAKLGNEKQNEMNQRISEIESQSNMLQEANHTIAAIAEQTNLLAMNAAIEAAHAGDAGKGFSVVADEIRKLSETSAAQSKTIGEQLSVIKNSIEMVVTTSEDTSETFSSVSESIHETDELVRQIKGAMEEQQEGSKQILEALKDMSNSTAEVKTASAEMSAGNKQILDEVRQLQDVTNLMKDSVTLMSSSAMKISETGTALDGISDDIKDSINTIGSQIDSFQV